MTLSSSENLFFPFIKKYMFIEEYLGNTDKNDKMKIIYNLVT